MDSSRLRLFKPASFDLVFVDGGHDFGTASRDTAAAFSLVHMGGVVAVHDYRPTVTSKGGVVTSSWPQVVAAVDDIAARSGWRIDRVVGDLAILRM
jgi:predicted O-methyltransferase YrrM